MRRLVTVKETTTHRELREDLVADGVVLFKIPDFPTSAIETETKDGGKKKFRFSPFKFVDLVGVAPDPWYTPMVTAGSGPPVKVSHHGVPLFWECKLVKQMRSWPLSALDDRQLDALLKVEKLAHAVVLVNYRVKPTDDQVAKYGCARLVSRGKINCLTTLLPCDIVQAWRQGMKSIPVAELLAAAVSRPWGGKWRLDEIQKAVWKPSWRQ